MQVSRRTRPAVHQKTWLCVQPLTGGWPLILCKLGTSGVGTKGCHSAIKADRLGMQFKMSRFNMQENGNTIFERGKERSLDRLKHLKLKPASQMPAEHDGTVDKENSFGELSLMLKTFSSKRSFRIRKNNRNRVRPSRYMNVLGDF